MNLKTRLIKYARSLIPTTRRPLFDVRTTPSELFSRLTADRLHEVLDNAEAGNTADLFALYRDLIAEDSHAQSEFLKRKLAVMGDKINILPADDGNPDDVAAADFIRANVRSCPTFLNGLSSALDSCLWPVTCMEKVFEIRRYSSGRSLYYLKDLIRVPYELYDFRTGALRILDLNDQGRPQPTSRPVDHNRYITHRGHLLSTPDNWGGPMRSVLFWTLLAMQNRGWWGTFLERYGTPFMIGRYDKNDDDSRMALEGAFSLARRIGGLAITRETEVEIKEVSTSSASDAFERFHAICQREKSKVILGQTLSAEAQSTGLGSGQQNLQGDVRQDIRQFDALWLGNTIRLQLFKQLLDINGFRGAPPEITFGGVSTAEAKALGEMVLNYYNSGLQPTDDGIKDLSVRSGIPFERRPATSMPGFGGFSAFSAPRPFIEISGRDDIISRQDGIARGSSAALARAFRGRHAAIRDIILDSRSQGECQDRLTAYLARFDPGEAADLLDLALQAYAANGVTITER